MGSNNKAPPPRKWLNDRIKGKSKYGDSHPPCCCCLVPAPVGWCPSLLEENIFCKLYGRIGCCAPTNEKARNWIIKIGFVFNIVALVLNLFSCWSISENYTQLNRASFSSGVLTSSRDSPLGGTVTFDVGLRAAAIDTPGKDPPIVVPFNEFCDLPSAELKQYVTVVMDATSCDACEQVSKGMVQSLLISLISYVPTLSTDILRLYSNYDVNCQKAFATLFALLTILLSLNTFLKYNNTCFAGFYDGAVYYDDQGNVITGDTSQAAFYINFAWQMGTGLRALYASTILKLVDIVCNVIIPSPSITRDLKEQQDYEALGEENEDGADEEKAGRTDNDDADNKNSNEEEK